MKRTIGLFLLLFPALSFSQTLTFSDPNFEKAVLDHDSIIDSNFDGKIQVSEANGVVELNLRKRNITSMKDLYFFPNVQKAVLTNNEITEVVLENLPNLRSFYAAENYLSVLKVTNFPSLTQLHVGGNLLKSIEIINVPNLESLGCHNNQLEKIDVSTFPKLKYLTVGNNNLHSLDISKNPEMIQVTLRNNSITEIDIRNNQNLKVGIMYRDDNVKVIGSENNQQPSIVVVTDNAGNNNMVNNAGNPPLEEVVISKSGFSRNELIDSMIIECKYRAVFNLLRKDLISFYAKQNKWEEKKMQKLESIIHFEDISEYYFTKGYVNYSNNELLKVIESCKSIEETTITKHLDFYSLDIILEFDRYIRSILDKN